MKKQSLNEAWSFETGDGGSLCGEIYRDVNLIIGEKLHFAPERRVAP